MNGTSGNGVHVTKATVAIIIAITGPTATAAVIAYRVGQTERAVETLRHETIQTLMQRDDRLRVVEAQKEKTVEALDNLAEQVRELRREIANMDEARR